MVDLASSPDLRARMSTRNRKANDDPELERVWEQCHEMIDKHDALCEIIRSNNAKIISLEGSWNQKGLKDEGK